MQQVDLQDVIERQNQQRERESEREMQQQQQEQMDMEDLKELRELRRASLREGQHEKVLLVTNQHMIDTTKRLEEDARANYEAAHPQKAKKNKPVQPVEQPKPAPVAETQLALPSIGSKKEFKLQPAKSTMTT